MEDTSQILKILSDDTIVTRPSDGLLKKQSSSNISVSVTAISGPRTGLSFQLEPDTDITLGRSPEAGLQVVDTGISRTHIRMRFDGVSVFVEDLKSANGTYINGNKLTDKIEIKNGDQVSIGVSTVLKFSLNNQLDAEYKDYIEDQLSKDILTKAYNRKAFAHFLNSAYISAKRDFSSLCLFMIDVDNFKTINDTYGHQIGDKILKHIADKLIQTVRSADIVCRYGGDEFAIVCPNISSLKGLQLAEQVRNNVEEMNFSVGDKKINTTLSIGVSNYPDNEIKCVSQFIAYADKAMYKAKRKGRNQIGLLSGV
ncbi:MAG: GGDEF domain-containing protein [Gammaproteobacteria bacterium]|nr:GGDEF domain-containing protein [Gammaproteobacteria bacterium]